MLVNGITSYTLIKQTQNFGKQNRSPVVYKNGKVYYTKEKSLGYINRRIEEIEKDLKNPKTAESHREIQNRLLEFFNKCLETIAEKGEVDVNSVKVNKRESIPVQDTTINNLGPEENMIKSGPVTYKNGWVFYNEKSIGYINRWIKKIEKDIKNPETPEYYREYLKGRLKFFNECLETIAKKGEVKVCISGFK